MAISLALAGVSCGESTIREPSNSSVTTEPASPTDSTEPSQYVSPDGISIVQKIGQALVKGVILKNVYITNYVYHRSDFEKN